MAECIDPKEFNLGSKTLIEKEAESHYILLINRKSRLIMSDGHRIAAKAEKIKTVQPGCKVSLKTTAPVCSKTVKFLSEIEIEII